MIDPLVAHFVQLHQVTEQTLAWPGELVWFAAVTYLFGVPRDAVGEEIQTADSLTVDQGIPPN